MKETTRLHLIKRLNRLNSYVILVIVALFLMIPVAFWLIGTFKQDSEYMTYPIKWLPVTPQWENYAKVFTMTPFLTIAFRTAVLAIVCTVISVFISSLAGFAFARIPAPGKGKVFSLIVAMLIMPGIVLLVPTFMIYAKLQLTNTYWPWIIGALAGSPFYIFLFRQFFLGFPKELEEAAEVDGCSTFRIYWQIFLPNAKPVFFTTMFFSFSGIWGDYLTPLIYLKWDNQLLAVVMNTGFVDPQGHPYKTISLAANLIYVLPLIVLFFIGQRYILKGVITSGLKG